MAIQQYGTVASRNLIVAEAKMLKYAEPIQVLTMFGTQKEHPKRKTDTIVFRRLKPFNATATEVPNITATDFLTAEGVTPTAHTISYTDVSVTLNHYAVLFKFSSKAEEMYEDDIPKDMYKQSGETLAEVAELVCYGQLKTGPSVIYSNGESRDAVNTAISLNDFRLAARTMESNRGRKITEAVKPGPNFGTSSVERSYIVFVHTDMMADIRDVPGITKRVDYGTAIKPVHPREEAAIEDFRIITSPLLAPWLASGSATLNGMVSAGSANVDVYPAIVTAADAWGQVSLKGRGYSSIRPTILSSRTISHANPSGMFGYVGADFWTQSVRLNDNWMTRIEAGVTNIAG